MQARLGRCAARVVITGAGAMGAGGSEARRGLFADDHFADGIPGEEEFHRGKWAEQFLDAAVVQRLGQPLPASRLEEQCFAVGDAERKGIHRVVLGFGVKACEQNAAGAKNPMEAGDERLRQGAGKVLKDVPDEDGIEGIVGEVERAGQPIGRGGAGDVERAQEILHREPVAFADDEGDVGLGELAEVEHLTSFQTVAFGERGEELLNAMTLAVLFGNCGSDGNCLLGVSGRRGERA